MEKLKNPRRRANSLAAMAFLAPNIGGFLVFVAGPVLLSLFMSFTNWSLKPGIELEWVGLRNYVDMFTDQKFWFYLYNTFYFMLAIPFTIAGSLFLANLLVDPMKMGTSRGRVQLATAIGIVGALNSVILFTMGRRDWALIIGMLFIAGVCAVLWGSMTYRTMFYIPSFASGVATMVLWTQVYSPYHGMANNLIQNAFDIVGYSGTPPMWLTSTQNLLGWLPLPESFRNSGFGLGAREAIMFMGFWMGIGSNNMILYIASISNIPDSLYEAAEIDGAGSFAKFFHITIPSVAPTTFFISIMSVIGGLQGGFQVAKIMTDGGGPSGTTTTLAYYIYYSGFEELRLGYASSVAWVLFIIVFALTLVNWKYGNRRMEM